MFVLLDCPFITINFASGSTHMNKDGRMQNSESMVQEELVQVAQMR